MFTGADSFNLGACGNGSSDGLLRTQLLKHSCGLSCCQEQFIFSFNHVPPKGRLVPRRFSSVMRFRAGVMRFRAGVMRFRVGALEVPCTRVCPSEISQ